jgi:hypothetical protein
MRVRRYIDKRQYDQLERSERFAREIGLPLNTMVTLQFGATGCDAEDVGPVFRRLIKNRFTPWLRPTAAFPRDDRPAAWFYCVENVHEHAHHPHGTHVHWFVHVPTDRRTAFEQKVPVWLSCVAGMIFDPDVAVHIQDANNPRGGVLYAGKGMKPHDAAKRRVKPKDQGVVHGRRLSISESINASAIAAHRERLSGSTLSVVTEQKPAVWPTPEGLLSELPWEAA